jgi:uncharacterized repeat protein (TIGR01451 family)
MLCKQPFHIDGLKNRALAMLATTAGLLALWGVAPAVAAPPQHEVPAATATTTSEADLATIMPVRGSTFKGASLRFTATVTNNGPDRAVHVIVTDTYSSLTATFSGVSASAPSGASCKPPVGGNATTTCTTPSLAPRGVMTVTVSLVAKCPYPHNAVGISASATSSTNDPNPANNSAGGALSCIN